MTLFCCTSSHKLSLQHPEKRSKLVVFQHFYQVKCDQFRKYSRKCSVLYFALFVNQNAHTLSCHVANLVSWPQLSCKDFSIFGVVYSVLSTSKKKSIHFENFFRSIEIKTEDSLGGSCLQSDDYA